MRSMHGRLVVSLLLSLFAMLLTLELSLYFYLSETLTSRFDQELSSRVEPSIRFYQRMVARFGIALPPGGPGARRGRSGVVPHFQVWTANGTPLVRSELLEGEDLPFWELPLDEPRLADVELPGGISGRVYAVRFRVDREDAEEPRGGRDWRNRGGRERDERREREDGAPRGERGERREDDRPRDERPPERNPFMPPPGPPPADSAGLGPGRPPADSLRIRAGEPDSARVGPRRRPAEEDSLRAVLASEGHVDLVLMVGRPRVDLDETLSTIALGLLLFALLVPLAAALCIQWSVSRGLRPLNRLTEETDAISPRQLSYRYSTEDLPKELRPLALRLNELLSTLQAAFQRERRFTADVAHELRTPIAELRSLAEVGLDWEPADGSPHEFFQDADAIARRMQNLVNTLLALVRSQSGMRLPALQRVDLGALVATTWQQHRAVADERGVRAELALPEQVEVTSDSTLLGSLLGNLCGNAAAYTDAGGTVEIAVEGGTVTIANTCSSLSADDLQHLCEPFWRKDAARTDGSHCGLGLALAHAHARLLGCELELSLAEGAFRARLRGLK